MHVWHDRFHRRWLGWHILYYGFLTALKSSNSCSPSARFISSKSPRVNESCLPSMCYIYIAWHRWWMNMIRVHMTRHCSYKHRGCRFLCKFLNTPWLRLYLPKKMWFLAYNLKNSGCTCLTANLLRLVIIWIFQDLKMLIMMASWSSSTDIGKVNIYGLLSFISLLL